MAQRHVLRHLVDIRVSYGEPRNSVWCRFLEVRKCLLSFGAEPFVFQVAIQKFKDQDI